MTRATGHEKKTATVNRANMPPGTRPNAAEYFQKLRLRLKLGLLAAFSLPVIALAVYFHSQFNPTLRETGKLHLASLAESQRNTIDLFLQERVTNIFSLFHGTAFTLEPSQQQMDRYLQGLRQTSDAFIDVGFCNSEGVQVGYAGPFPDLYGKDYSNEDWFVSVMERDTNYHVSDIYLGFRKRPHFTIAVKQLIDARPYVMRATLDPDKFYMFLRNISRGKGVDSVLVNKGGYYQVVAPDRGALLGKSKYMPPGSEGAGVEEIGANGDSILVAYVWLRETPWVLMVRQPLEIAYAQVYRSRKIMIASTAAIMAVMGFLVWMMTDRSLKGAQATAESHEKLQSELIHASKMASVGELAAGIAHEINNPLAVVVATTGVIRDLFDPEFHLPWTPETIREELANIDKAVFRARGITQTLLKFSRRNPPRLALGNLNSILDEVVGGLKEQEFQVSNIELVRDYQPDLPEIPIDVDQISQVFLNLINNAGDAIDGAGTITLSTRRNDSSVRVTVTDTGAGMTSEVMQQVFLPFYSTKEVGRGTGLGLSVSSSIVESFGGRIEVQSMPGAGSSFTVVFPVNQPETVENE
ncbi:MAG TPA: ATP-binding protein [Thermoguttaceae bacterium]|nr:ATP-binding protein [Thermoguttaceae bacterium]